MGLQRSRLRVSLAPVGGLLGPRPRLSAPHGTSRRTKMSSLRYPMAAPWASWCSMRLDRKTLILQCKTVTSDIGVDATFNASSVDYSFTCYKAVTTTDRVLLAYITKSYRSKLVVWMSQRRRSNYKILFWQRKEMLVVWKIYLNNKSQWCKANEVNYIYRYRLMEWLIC